MFQLIVMSQGIEKVMIQIKNTFKGIFAIGAELFLSKVPLEVLQNWVLIQINRLTSYFHQSTGSSKRRVPIK